MRKILVIFISIPIALFVILEIFFSYSYFTSRRTPDKFVIPDSYQGWVTIELENPDCPALPIKDNRRFFAIENDGKFCTSSPQNPGWAEDLYTYQSEPETNLMQNPVTGMNRIWNESHKEKFYYFYVGAQKPKADQ